jgi:glycosyltransferase involved in cell wall biosynthesis
MTARARVSIVTLTYNQAAFLPQCLESVRSQTFADWEQVVLDDESTDDTEAVVQRYRSPRLRYVRQPHVGIEGLPRSYARALSMCTAPLVAFVDGDDYWPRERLELLIPLLEDPAVVLAYGRTMVIPASDHDGRRVIPSPEIERDFPSAIANAPVGSAARLLLDARYLAFVFLVSAVLRRSALDKIGGLQTYPGLPVMDYPTVLHLSLAGSFGFLPHPTGYWRLHGRNTTSQAWGSILVGVRRQALAFRSEFARKLPLTGEDWTAIDNSWKGVHAQLQDHLSLEGRRHLLRGRWRDGRQAFLETLRGPATLKHRLFLGICVLLSLLHRDAEWLVRLLGRRPLDVDRS